MDNIRLKDFFLESENVHEINRVNFSKFLQEKETIFLMFYDPLSVESVIGKRHLEIAARKTNREDHAYAGFNCFRDPLFCEDEKVMDDLPVFKMYFNGRLIETFTDVRNVQSSEMQNYVEKCPVIVDRAPCKDDLSPPEC